jgi:hypothetical protein
VHALMRKGVMTCPFGSPATSPATMGAASFNLSRDVSLITAQTLYEVRQSEDILGGQLGK